MTKKEKIACFFATSGHSGVDRAMQHLIPALARRGYEIDLLHIRKHGPYLDEVPAGVNIIDLGTKHVYPSFPALVRYLRAAQPDVMLTDKDRVNRTALLARAWAGTKTRLVVSSGTTISIDLKNRGAFERWLQRTSMGKLYPHADNVIVTSTGVADDMATYTGLPRESINVVPSPVVPAELFTEEQPLPEHPWLQNKSKPVILGVGELCMRKDFTTLIQAFAKVREQLDCRLIILGRGRQKDELTALCQSLGVSEHVDFPGFVADPYHYMAHADLFAFTSRWEGLGFVIIEALAVGTPVVATDCPSGPREILEDGKYGPLVTVGNVEALSQNILTTLHAPLAREILQQAARPYEIENSTTAYIQALLKIENATHASIPDQTENNNVSPLKAVNNHRIACFFSTSGHSGVDRFVKNLIPAMARRGYLVDVLHVRKHGPHIKNPPPGVRVIDLGSRHTYACIWSLIRYLRKYKPVVMLSDKDRVNRTALLAKFLTGVPTRLVISQGTTISIMLAHRKPLDRWIQRWSIKHLYPYADHIFVTSNGVADDMAEYTGLDRKLIEVVPTPVADKHWFENNQPFPAHPWYKEGEPPVIIGVGELSKLKDYATLVRAFALIRRSRPCRLMILGEGTQRKYLEELADKLGISPDFTLPGYVDNPYPFMAHAKLFVHTSLLEGLSSVIVEALSLGTPTVCTDCPSGPAEILQGGKYGQLVTMGDETQLASAISETLDKPLPRHMLQEAAKPYEIENSTTAYLQAMHLIQSDAQRGI